MELISDSLYKSADSSLVIASMLLLGVFFTVDISAAVQNQLMHISPAQHFDIYGLE
jgi:hypothetical protein